ncbi:unnamed protein product [Urochloa decumbens]|uniref:F-box domain-containing protein n=1 Tax=Urochloa decumbens TaxID=240449 RepID=A0ABC9HFV0_9POAL
MEETARDQKEMEQQEDLTRLLPADVLAEVLRRLPHRGLAVSRCVCKAWRSAIDARRLMLRHLLPHSLGGIYLRFCGSYTLQLLARPTADDPKIPTRLGYLPPASGSGYPDGNNFDHCNGLLLIDDAVVNPATGKWANLPPHPDPLLTESDDLYLYKDMYLVFDPTVSMHFEVISIDRLLDGPDPAIQASEWPPSPYIIHVFSSRSWQWEARSFLREGEAAGTIADMRPLCPLTTKGYAVLWKGELYVQCESNFVMSFVVYVFGDLRLNESTSAASDSFAVTKQAANKFRAGDPPPRSPRSCEEAIIARSMKKQQATDLPALLPEDVLAGVLGRLAPRGVATCRCVCKAWRAVIDAHALLRAELLPRSLAGILVNFHGLCVTEFVSRPGSAADSSFVRLRRRILPAARHRHVRVIATASS